MKTILVIDDEEKIRDVVVSYLQKEGYAALAAANGTEGLTMLKNQPVDLLILDLMLPDLSGEEVCAQVRRESSLPILMLTARVTLEDRVKGLSLGADDYLIKPFSPRELVARVKAILRRSTDTELLADRIVFTDGELVIDTLRSQVLAHEQPLSLTPNEYKLLVVLARHPQRIFTRDELIEKVLGYDFDGDARTIDQHIKNVRQKIEPDQKHPKYVVTVYGVGYKFTGGVR